LNATTKTLLLWVSIVALAVLAFSKLQSGQEGAKEIEFSKHLEEVRAGSVYQVKVSGPSGQDVRGRYRASAREFTTTKPADFDDYYKVLGDNGVEWTVEAPKGASVLGTIFTYGPLLLLVVFWIVFMRQMQSGGNKALSFGKAKAKMFSSQQRKITFKDVAGVDEAKEDLQEIIEFLKEPQKFQKLGGKIPKGVLLMGPPGTGKTLLARGVSGEANVPFFSISGSDFVEMFVGVGASRVRDLFEQGKKNAPCIIFIDEIDAVGRHRGAGLGGGHDEREQTLNQLLTEMDGFESNEGVIIIAATNRPDVLDPALLRPGRFDRRVVVDRPDIKGRSEILEVHCRKIPLDGDVDLNVVARGTPGFSGADIANLVNEAALKAARSNKKMVQAEDFDFARDKVLMGSERRSLILSDAEKRNTAYHESGHALLAAVLPNADPIHKVSVIPRGRALGVTQQLPLMDRHTYSKEYLTDMLAVMMGGRAAEEVVFGTLTTGAGDDIERATDLARRMVCELGMSGLGPLTFGKREELVFLGREISQQRNYSEATAVDIDGEVKRLVSEAYARARSSIEEHRQQLVAIAEALLERESLDGEEVTALLRGRTLPERQLAPRAADSRPARLPGERAPAGEAAAPRLEPKPSEGLGSA
jgi:cell division protease FtsH